MVRAKCKHIPDELWRWQANIVTTIFVDGRLCTKFIKENEKSWKKDEDDRKTERNRKEAANRKKQLAEQRAKEKNTQQKITENWKRIPEHEKRHLMQEEDKRRRL